MKKLASLALALTFGAAAAVSAQQPAPAAQAPAAQAPQAPAQAQQRPLSPPGAAAAIVGGEWTKNAQGREVYQGAKWLEITYSRPMLRQRANIFGTGADYGKTVKAGSAVWRAGANSTTTLKTEVPLVFAGKTVPAGEYGLLVDLKSPTEWTLIITSQPRMAAFDPNNKTELNGATNYDPKFDVVRVPMLIENVGMQVDQMSIFFCDVTKDAGKIAIAWDHIAAAAPFTVAPTAAAAPAAPAQPAANRPLSPRETSTTMVGGEWKKNAEGALAYEGGKWIEVSYGRPMLRQRPNIFGSGAEYGKAVLAGAPVWRVGANQSTRFKTEVPLTFGGKTLPAGEYSMFVDLKSPTEWTLIFSNWAAQPKHDANDKTALWGAYEYTPAKDVLRVPMTVANDLDSRVEQLAIVFGDVTKNAGTLAIVWDRTVATVPFKVR